MNNKFQKLYDEVVDKMPEILDSEDLYTSTDAFIDAVQAIIRYEKEA